MFVLLQFLVSLVGLWFGAEWVTRGSINLSKRVGLSEAFIGLTIIALGTSLPEVMVSLTGAVDTVAGNPAADLVVGNIIGSSIGQISLVLGLAGLFRVIKVHKSDVVFNGGVMLLSTIAFLFLAHDGVIGRVDGIILLIGYGLYLLISSQQQQKVIKAARRKQRRLSISEKDTSPIWWHGVTIVDGLAVVIMAAEVLLTSAVSISQILGMSQAVVGVLLVGLGTSMPELVVSMNAALRGSSDLSVGNLIGSNITVMLLALGLGSTIANWSITDTFRSFDVPYLLVISVVILGFLLTRLKLERHESILVVSLYAGYVALKLLGF